MAPETRGSFLEDLPHKLHLDNTFRLALSLTTFSLAVYLWVIHVIPDIRSITILMAAYSVPYLLVWWLIPRINFLRPLDYFLTAMDIGGITCCIQLTGGSQSP